MKNTVPGARGRTEPAVLLTAAAALIAIGAFCLIPSPGAGHRPPTGSSSAQPPSASPAIRGATSPSPRAAESGTTSARPPSSPAPSSPSPAPPRPSAAPAQRPVAEEEGEQDRAIQRVLSASRPADLPARTERKAVRDAWRWWRSDVTGGADEHSHYRYRRVRLQAGIARRAQHGRIQVRLVWAGAGPAGEYRDRRTAHLVFDPSSGHWEAL